MVGAFDLARRTPTGCLVFCLSHVCAGQKTRHFFFFSLSVWKRSWWTWREKPRKPPGRLKRDKPRKPLWRLYSNRRLLFFARRALKDSKSHLAWRAISSKFLNFLCTAHASSPLFWKKMTYFLFSTVFYQSLRGPSSGIAFELGASQFF